MKPSGRRNLPPLLVFNYARSIKPKPTTTVPRIIFPKKLPRHTVDTISWSQWPSKPYVVREREPIKGLFRYVIRTHDGARIVSPRRPPPGLEGY